MRKDRLYALGTLAFCIWMSMTYFLFVHRPNAEAVRRRLGFDGKSSATLTLTALSHRVDEFEKRLKQTSDENSQLLQVLREAVKESQKQEKHNNVEVPAKEPNAAPPVAWSLEANVVIPVLMFACNRVTVAKALDSLLQIRKDKHKFPIIVSQDCGHAETAQVIQSYGDEIQYIQQPDLSHIDVPKKERRFQGYFKIARHYGWALNQVFNVMNYEQVIIVEDDLLAAPDFYEYFEATLPILKADKSLWCVSAWNDNGKGGLIDQSTPELLYRTDFFGGLGWMLTKELWSEIGPKWPKSYWDDWMRNPAQRKGRACIRPEIPRTKTFGKVGVSNGLFFDKHLKFIELNANPVDFVRLDLSYLLKQNYDKNQVQVLNKSPVVSMLDLKNGQVQNEDAVRVN